MQTQAKFPAVRSRKPRLCEQCGGEYKPRRDWQRFCKASCRLAFNVKVTREGRAAWYDQAEKVSDEQQTE